MSDTDASQPTDDDQIGKPSADIPPHPDDDETICYCIGVSRRQLREAFHRKGCRDLASVVRATGAMGGCMTCRYDIEDVLRQEAERFPEPE